MALVASTGRGELGRLRRFVPPAHHLFAAFAVPAAAIAAVDQAEASPLLAIRETWIFQGEDGARRLDPYAVIEGRFAVAFRAFVWIFSLNVEYLHGLSRSVAGGLTAVAVRVGDQRTADQVARLLSAYGGHSFAYATHGNYVPVLL